MTEKERAENVRRLLVMQGVLLSLTESLAETAKVCRDADELGLAFSLYMVKESVDSYRKQVKKFTLKMVGDDT
jgi:hypothetical protein